MAIFKCKIRYFLLPPPTNQSTVSEWGQILPFHFNELVSCSSVEQDAETQPAFALGPTTSAFITVTGCYLGGMAGCSDTKWSSKEQL